MHEHETTISLFGEEVDALIEFEPDFDPDGNEDNILITSVEIRRCTHQRGDMLYSPDGQAFPVTFPQYAKVEILPIMLGKQIAELAKQILGEKAEEDWASVMNEPKGRGYAADFPSQFPGVRL